MRVRQGRRFVPWVVPDEELCDTNQNVFRTDDSSEWTFTVQINMSFFFHEDQREGIVDALIRSTVVSYGKLCDTCQYVLHTGGSHLLSA